MSKPCRPGDEHYERFLATVLAHVRDDPDFQDEIASEVDERLEGFIGATKIFANLGLDQQPVFRALPAGVDSYQSMSVRELCGRLPAASKLWAESHPGGASEGQTKGSPSASKVLDEIDDSEPDLRELSASELDFCRANFIEPKEFLAAKRQRGGQASMKVKR